MNLYVNKLTVKHNDKIVGYLKIVANDKIAFQYDDEWQKYGFSISPLSLPLSNEVYISNSPHFNGLFGVFNDSLPDGWGELLVRKMLAKQGVNFDNLNALTRLSLIRDNGLGGLSFVPTQVNKDSEFDFDLDEIANQAADILDDSSNASDLDKIYEMGGSSGGARPKAHLKINNDYWIVKFPTKQEPKAIGQLEFNANELAKKCGINTNIFQLFTSKRNNKYFGSKRFDRVNGQRIHMISLSAILETSHRLSNLDYMHLFQVIQKICINQEDIYEAYKRMCFNVLYGNKDDHGKNFAFIYNEQEKGYKISPFYDITKTNDKLEHEMTILGNGQPTEEDLIKIAKELKLSINKCEDIINHIKNVIV